MRICPNCERETEELYCPNDSFPTIDKEMFGSSHALEGQKFGEKFRIIRLLGQGGFGAVYQAQQLDMNRFVAIKMMHEYLGKDITAVKRFYREVQTSSQLRHPNTVRIFEFGSTPDHVLYFTMEYLEGLPLAKVIKQQAPLEEKRARRMVTQVLKSLAEAHALGMVHRDLKPDNIFLADIPGETDFVKVLDFGIVKFVQGDKPEGTLTATGQTFGTPRYMSPEQAACDELDGRSDLYALGIIMYEMFSGSPPFKDPSAMRLLIKHMQQPPPPLPDDLPVSDGMRQLIMHLLAKKPADRPAGAKAVLERIAAMDEVDLERRSQQRIAQLDQPTALLQTPTSGVQQAIPPVEMMPASQELPTGPKGTVRMGTTGQLQAGTAAAAGGLESKALGEAPRVEPSAAPPVEPSAAPPVEPSAAPPVEPSAALWVEPSAAPPVEPSTATVSGPVVVQTGSRKPFVLLGAVALAALCFGATLAFLYFRDGSGAGLEVSTAVSNDQVSHPDDAGVEKHTTQPVGPAGKDLTGVKTAKAEDTSVPSAKAQPMGQPDTASAATGRQAPPDATSAVAPSPRDRQPRAKPRVAPKPKPVRLQIVSVPPGAKVYVDGAAVGNAPVQVQLKRKRTKLMLVKKGYEKLQKTIRPRDARKGKMVFRLEKKIDPFGDL